MYNYFYASKKSLYVAGDTTEEEDDMFHAYRHALCNLQMNFECTCPALPFYKTWMSSIVSSEGSRQQVKHIFDPSDLHSYNAHLEAFMEKPYLNVVVASGPEGCRVKKIAEQETLHLSIRNRREPFTLLKVLSCLPFDGCTGVVLKHATKPEFVICFRSAIETSTFMKIGTSSMLSTPYPVEGEVAVNAFLGTLYWTHYAEAVRAALAPFAKTPSTIRFLGFSMGAALCQMCMYDVFAKTSMFSSWSQTHLLFGSPRCANQNFYEDLAVAKVEVETHVAATNYKSCIYIDPIPCLDCGFVDPPHQFLLGQLDVASATWTNAMLDMSTSMPFKVQRVRCTRAFRNVHRCHPMRIFGSFVSTMFHSSNMALHNTGYFNITYHGIITKAPRPPRVFDGLEEEELTPWESGDEES